jgi:hypothetical protein
MDHKTINNPKNKKSSDIIEITKVRTSNNKSVIDENNRKNSPLFKVKDSNSKFVFIEKEISTLNNKNKKTTYKIIDHINDEKILKIIEQYHMKMNGDDSNSNNTNNNAEANENTKN